MQVVRTSPRSVVLAAVAMLAVAGHAAAQPTDRLPDLTVAESAARGYMHDWFTTSTEIPGRTLLRFTNAMPNLGVGAIEVQRGALNMDGTTDIYQRIYNTDGGFRDQFVGAWVQSVTNMTTIDDIARFTLRQVLDGGGVGPAVATSHKEAICMLDSTRFNSSLPGSPVSRQYFACSIRQGISVGWADIYPRTFDGQYVDITGVVNGMYWLQSEIDPHNVLLELNDANNFARIPINLTTGLDPRADLDADYRVTAHDIDQLLANLGSEDPDYDLNQSGGPADQTDVNHMVRDVLDTEFGDVNLDKQVDIDDLRLLATAFGAEGGWADGNLDGAHGVNIRDLSLLATYFGADTLAGAAASTVPLPPAIAAPAAALLLVRLRRPRAVH